MLFNLTRSKCIHVAVQKFIRRLQTVVFFQSEQYGVLNEMWHFDGCNDTHEKLRRIWELKAGRGGAYEWRRFAFHIELRPSCIFNVVPCRV